MSIMVLLTVTPPPLIFEVTVIYTYEKKEQTLHSPRPLFIFFLTTPSILYNPSTLLHIFHFSTRRFKQEESSTPFSVYLYLKLSVLKGRQDEHSLMHNI